jgi:hypothetical protein
MDVDWKPSEKLGPMFEERHRIEDLPVSHVDIRLRVTAKTVMLVEDMDDEDLTARIKEDLFEAIKTEVDKAVELHIFDMTRIRIKNASTGIP